MVKQPSIATFFGGSGAAQASAGASKKGAGKKGKSSQNASTPPSTGKRQRRDDTPEQAGNQSLFAQQKPEDLKRVKKVDDAPLQAAQLDTAGLEDSDDDGPPTAAGTPAQSAGRSETVQHVGPTEAAPSAATDQNTAVNGSTPAAVSDPPREGAGVSPAEASTSQPHTARATDVGAGPWARSVRSTRGRLPAKSATAADQASDAGGAGAKEEGSSKGGRDADDDFVAGDDDSGGDVDSGSEEEGDEAQADAGDGEADDQEAQKAAFKKAFKQPKKASAAKMEGVGTGSLAAAALHKAFDVQKVAEPLGWKSGAPAPYALLAITFDDIAPESKRLAIIALLTATFRAIIELSPEDLLPAVYLCVSRVAPAHEGLELGIGDAILFKALANATGRSEGELKRQYQAEGDIGVVASANKGRQGTLFKPQPLTIRGVFAQLKAIAKVEGHKSQDAKVKLINKLLVAAKDAEPAFIVRSLQGKLRIGLAEQSVLVALAHAVALQGKAQKGELPKGDALANHLETATLAVRNAFCECPSYDRLVPALLEHGTQDLLEHVHFVAGTPIKAMLARPTNGVTEVLDKFSDCDFTCEYKYDGERAQVHVLEDGSVQIYSRNLENTTAKYPDIVARMATALAPGTKSIVLDCEAQAWDPEKKVFLPFQVLTTRKRKDVKEEDVTVQVVLYCFDCLYLNGDVMLRRPLVERREAMYGAIVPQDGKIQFATTKTSRDIEELQTFLAEAVDACTEGLIVKTLKDSYEPSKRSLNWLKLKKDYMDGCGDTFDVVVIGALHGKGKRTGGFGSFLLAVYDAEAEEYQSISKIGTGFSEELLKSVSAALQAHIIDKPPRYYRWNNKPLMRFRLTDKLVPDVWFEPKVVWEVKAADLSISPVYTAALGKVDRSKGISIRFPRLVRERDDKGPEDTTSPEQVADMYSRQAVVNKSSKGAAGAADADFW